MNLITNFGIYRLSDNQDDRPAKASGSQFRPLYDIPFMFEAREFLRKKLIGQNVHITVDYIQPANTNGAQEFPEKTCCTVAIGMLILTFTRYI